MLPLGSRARDIWALLFLGLSIACSARHAENTEIVGPTEGGQQGIADTATGVSLGGSYQ